MTYLVAKKRVVPLYRPPERPGVGVQHNLVRVEAVPAFGFKRPVNPVAVKLAGAQRRRVAVPDGAGALRQDESHGRLGVIRMVKKKQLHAPGVLAEKGKVDPQPVPGRPER